MQTEPYSYRRTIPATWIRAILYFLLAIGLAWYFGGDYIRTSLERWGAARRALVPPLVVSFPGYEHGPPRFVHYDLVPVQVRVQDKNQHPLPDVRPRVEVVRFAEAESPETPDAEPETMALIVANKVVRPHVPLRYDSHKKAWVGQWPVPIAAAEGTYYVRAQAKLPRRLIDVPPTPQPTGGVTPKAHPSPTPGDELVEVGPIYTPFQIAGAKPLDVPEPVGVCTLEAEADIAKLTTIRGPDGSVGDWRKLFDWVEFIGGNVLWIQGPTTTAHNRKLDPDFPWLADNLGTINLLGPEAKRRGLKFGVWIIAYRVVGERSYLPHYKWGAYDGYRGSPSLWDPLRVRHLTEATRWLAQKEFVDFVGFDYFRDSTPSYDDADGFVRNMHPPAPEDWEAMTPERRESWLRQECRSYNVADPRNQDIYFGWGYWRARRTAHILRQIIEDGKIDKPMWAFTLASWHGLEHGQDPVMLRDAGLALDAVMLYPEHRRATFSGIINAHWQPYASSAALNIVLGNQMNDALHGRTRIPPGPQDYYDRFEEAFRVCSTVNQSRVVGFFAHDLARLAIHDPAMFGPYPPSEWAIAAAACMTRVRCSWPRPAAAAAIPLTIEFHPPEAADRNEWFPADLAIVNHSQEPVADLVAEPLWTEGVELQSQALQPLLIPGGQQGILPMEARVQHPGADRQHRHMLAVRLRWSGAGTYHQAVCFRYVAIR